jgi:hypothetical protein
MKLISAMSYYVTLRVGLNMLALTLIARIEVASSSPSLLRPFQYHNYTKQDFGMTSILLKLSRSVAAVVY